MEIVNTSSPDSPINSTLMESREALETLLNEVAMKRPSVPKENKKEIFTRIVTSITEINNSPEILPKESYNTIGRALLHYAERLGEGDDEGNELSSPTIKHTISMVRQKEMLDFLTNLCSGFTKDNFYKLILDCGKTLLLLPQNGQEAMNFITTAVQNFENPSDEVFDTLLTKSYLKVIAKNSFCIEFYCSWVVKPLFEKGCLTQNALNGFADFIIEWCNSDANVSNDESLTIKGIVNTFGPNDISRNFVSNTLIPRMKEAERPEKNKNFCALMWGLLEKDVLPENCQVSVFVDTLDLVKNIEKKEGENIRPGVMNNTVEEAFVWLSNVGNLKNILRRETILEAISKVCSDIKSGSLKTFVSYCYNGLENLLEILDSDEETKRINNEHKILTAALNETFSYAKGYEEKFRGSGLEDLSRGTFLYGYGPFNGELNVRLQVVSTILRKGIESEEDKLAIYEIWNNLFVRGFCEYERKLIACWIAGFLKECVPKRELCTSVKPSIDKIGEYIKTMPPALITSCLDVFRLVFYFENEGLVGIDTMTRASPVLCSYQPTTANTLKMYDSLWNVLGASQHFYQQLETFKVLLELSNGSESNLLREYIKRVRELSRDECQSEHQDELASLIRFYNEYFVVKHLKEKRENKLFSDNQNAIIKYYSTNSNTSTFDITCTFMNTKAKFAITDVNPLLTDVYTLQRRVVSFLEKLNGDIRTNYDVTQLRFKVVPNGPEFSAIDYHDAGFAFLSDQKIGITSSVEVEVSAVDKRIIEQEKKNGGVVTLERLGNKNYNDSKTNRNIIIECEKRTNLPRKLAIIIGKKSGWNIDNLQGYMQHKEYYAQSEAIKLKDEDVIFEEDTNEEIEKIIRDNNEVAKIGKTSNPHTTKASQFFKGPKQIVEVYDAETLKNRLNAFDTYDYERTFSEMTDILISLLDSELYKVSNAAWQALRFAPVPRALIDRIAKDENALEGWINDFFPPESPFKGLYLLSVLRYVLNTDFSGKLSTKFSQENVKMIFEDYVSMTEGIVQSYDAEAMCCEEALQGALTKSFGSLIEASESSKNERLIISYIHILLMALCRGYGAESSLDALREIFTTIAGKEELANTTNAKCFCAMVMLMTIQSFEKTRTLDEAKAITLNVPFIKLGLRCTETANLCSKLIEVICSTVVLMGECSAESKMEFLGGLVSEMFKWMDDLCTQQFYGSLLASLGSLMKLVPEAERAKYSHYPETILKAAVAIADGTDTNTSKEHVLGIFKLFETSLSYYRDIFNSVQDTRVLLKTFAITAYKKYLSTKGDSDVRKTAMSIIRNVIENDREIAQQLLTEALPDIDSWVKGSKFVTSRGFWEYYPGYEKTIATIEAGDDTDKKKGYLGLTNTGNTCYMNSVLQQMYHIAPLRKAIINIDLSLIRSEALAPVEKLKALFESMDDRKKTGEAVREFAKTIDSPDFNVHRQQDADEFFGLIYDKLETALKDTQHWKEVSHVFSGQTMNIYTTPEGKVNKVKEPFRNVTVPVVKSVCAGFEELVKPEELETKAVKKTVFLALPPVLTIQLNRFVYSNELRGCTKNNSTVQLEGTLDMTKYMQESELENVDPALMKAYSKYKLRGVILHQGERATCGHYFSYIKADKNEENSGSGMQLDSSWDTFNEREREWMCFNDTNVSSLSKYDIDHLMREGCVNEYNKPSSYILFYERELVPSVDGVILPYCEVEGGELNKEETVKDEEMTDMTEDEMQKISHVIFSDEHLNFVFALSKAVAPLVADNNEVKDILFTYFTNVVIRSKLFGVMREWSNLIKENWLRNKEDAERFVKYLMQKNLAISVLGTKSCAIAAGEFEKVVMHGIDLLIEDEKEALKSMGTIDEKSQDEWPLLVKFFGDIINNIKLVNNNVYIYISIIFLKLLFKINRKKSNLFIKPGSSTCFQRVSQNQEGFSGRRLRN